MTQSEIVSLQQKVIKSMATIIKLPVHSFKQVNGIPQNSVFKFHNRDLGYRVYDTEKERYVHIEKLGSFKCLYHG
jgi:hypothetical protein